MKFIPFKLRRVFAYLVQLLLIIIVFLILKMIIGYVTITILEKYFLHFNITALNDVVLTKETLLNIASNTNVADFITFYKKLLLTIIIYSLIVYAIVPLLVKQLFFIVGDVGKMIFYLDVYGKQEKASNRRSIPSSLAFKTFKILYVITLFVTITIPLFKTFPVDKLPKVVHIFIMFIYIISIIQIIFYVIQLLSYAIRFIIGKDNWRSKKGLRVIDKFSLNKDEITEKSGMTEKDGMTENITNNQGIQIKFPLVYNFMISKGYSSNNYFVIQQKASEIEKVNSLLLHLEAQQKQDPNYIHNNEQKIISIINLL